MPDLPTRPDGSARELARPSPDVLGRLLLLHAALQAAPDEQRLAEMLVHGASGIPGVSGVVVCIDGRRLGSSGDDAITPDGGPAGAVPGSPAEALPCDGRHPTGWQLVPLAAMRAEHGHLAIRVVDPDAFEPCRPHLANVANHAALRISNDRNLAATASLNRRLEDEVRARTAELRESVADLELAVDASGGWFWEWDLVSGAMTWVDGLHDFFAIPRGATPSFDTFLDAIEPEDRDAVLAEVERARSDRDAMSVEARVRVAGREVRWLGSRGRFAYAPDGTATRVTGIAHDTTDRHRADELARERMALQERFTAMAESVPGAVGTAEMRPDGKVVLVMGTPAIDDVYGIPREELERDMGAVVAHQHPEDRARSRVEVERAAAAGMPYHLEYRYDHPSKGLRWLSTWSKPYTQPDGTVLWHGFTTDVTAQHTADESVREEKERLAVTLASIGDGVIATDARGQVTLMNTVAEQITGWSAAEAERRPLEDVFPIVAEDTGEPVESPVAHVLRDGVAVGLANHVALVVRDGSLRPVADSAAPIRDGEGAISGVVLVFRDRTLEREREREREEAAARLRESERRYRLLADHALDVIWMLDLATVRFTYVSPSIVRLRGLSVEEAMSESIEDSLTPESWERADRVMRAIGTPSEEDPHVGIYDQPCRDGSIRHVEMTTTYLRDADGVAVAALGVSRDATERVNAERALRDSEARFRALIDRSSDLIVLLDASLKITFASPSFIEVVGMAPEAVLGERLRRFIHPDDVPTGEASLAAMAEGQPGHATLRLGDADRGWRLIDGRARNLLDDPAVGAVVLNGRDVTEEHELVERLQQTQKLESVGRLAGGIAHDFNNLLTVILSYAESLADDVGAGVVPPLDDVAAIQASGRRAGELTRQLLAFARKTVIKPVTVDLNALIVETERLLRRVISEDIELRVRPGAGLWRVRVDRGQIEQVLVNLAVNARDAMPLGGVLTVATDNVPAGSERGREHPSGEPLDLVRISVSDTGIGITEAVRAHLFEPFFTTKAPGKGTGLGLATVHGIVAQGGGHLHVRSELRRGTTFEVLLPRSLEEPEPAAAPGESVSAPGSEVVLVVEDDALVRGVTVRSLRQAGYEVLVAEGPFAALALPAAELGRVAVLVTDVVMPGMDGRALATRLTRENPRLRTLFVSGYTEDTIAQRGVLADGVDFLRKPFTPAALQARVRSILDRPADP